MRLDTAGPVASTSVMQLDTTRDSSSHQPLSVPQADGDDEDQDDEQNWRSIQRMYNFACIQWPDYAMEEPDNIVEWSQPSETYNANAPTSAAFTRYGLMLSVLEPVEAEEEFKGKLQVCHRNNVRMHCLPFCCKADDGLFICDMCTVANPEQEPCSFINRSSLKRHT